MADAIPVRGATLAASLRPPGFFTRCMMLQSPLVPGVRGLDQALEFLDKESVVPLLIVAVKLQPNGMHTYVLDASPLVEDEHLRVAIMANVLQSITNKLTRAPVPNSGG